MSDLPPGWERVSLSDITLPYLSIDPLQSPNAEFRYIDIGSIDNKNQSIARYKTFAGADAPSRARRVIAAGDVLFSTVRTYLKNIAIVPEGLDGHLTSTAIAVLRPNAAVDNRYLFNALRSSDFVSEISSAQDGTLYPAVTEAKMGKATLPLAPLAEQKRIVKRLETLLGGANRAKTELQAIPELVALLKRRYLDRAFSGELTAEWRSDKNSKGDWVNKQLGEVITDIIAGKNLRCDERPPLKNERGVVKVSAVSWGEFDPAQSKTLPSTFEPAERTRIRNGDLLISRANTLELVGSVALVRTEPTNLYLSDKVLRLELPSADKAWVMWFLRSPQGRGQIESRASGNQLSMLNLSQKKLLEIQAPWPSENERKEIISRIDRMFSLLDGMVADHAQVTDQLASLEETIISRAFRGELTRQEPSDEPISVILAQVKAMRTASVAARPRRAKPSPQIEELAMTAQRPLEAVLKEAGDWILAQAAFQRCGLSDGSSIEEVEEIYAQLRKLDGDNKLEIQIVIGEDGRKISDKIRLKAK